jgi:hypothetical protein
MIAVGMGDEIGIRLNTGLGSAAGVNGKEMRVEADAQMGGTASKSKSVPIPMALTSELH